MALDLLDSIGGNHLTNNGSVGTTTGQVNEGALFSGTNWLHCADHASLNTEGFTWEVGGYVKLGTPGTVQCVKSKHDPSMGSSLFDIYASASLSGQLSVSFYDAIDGYFVITSGVVMDADTWYPFVIGWDGTNAYVSVNSESGVTNPAAGGGIDDSGPLRFGNDWVDQKLTNGSALDECYFKINGSNVSLWHFDAEEEPPPSFLAAWASQANQIAEVICA